MAQKIKAILFRADRVWLLAATIAATALIVAGVVYKTHLPEVQAFLAANITNNGAPADTVAGSEADVLILDVTLPTPATDTVLSTGTDATQQVAAGNALEAFDSNEKFTDNNAGGTFTSGEAIIDSADSTLDAGVLSGAGTDDIITDGTAAITSFLATDWFADTGAFSTSYEDGEAIIDSADGALTAGTLGGGGTDEVLVDGGANLTSFAAADRFSDTDNSGTYDNGEAIVDTADASLDAGVLSGAGTDDVLLDGTSDIEAFAGTFYVYDDTTLGNNNDYDDGEAVWSSADAALDAADSVVTSGAASVYNFVGGDNVCFDDSAGDNEVTPGTDTIFVDEDVDGLYTSAADALVDADGTGTTGAGVDDDSLADGAALLDVDAADILCTDSIASPTDVWVDLDLDDVYTSAADSLVEADGTGGTVGTGADDDGLAAGATLTAVDAADALCTDSVGTPTQIWVDLDSDSAYTGGIDSAADCDGAGSAAVGACTAPTAGDALTALLGTEDLCTDSLAAVTVLYVDGDGDCISGSGGADTTLLDGGAGIATATTSVGTNWAFRNDTGGATYDVGDDIYVNALGTSGTPGTTYSAGADTTIRDDAAGLAHADACTDPSGSWAFSDAVVVDGAWSPGGSAAATESLWNEETAGELTYSSGADDVILNASLSVGEVCNDPAGSWAFNDGVVVDSAYTYGAGVGATESLWIEQTAGANTYSSIADTKLVDGSGLVAGDACDNITTDPEVVFLDADHGSDFDYTATTSSEPLINLGDGGSLINGGDLATSIAVLTPSADVGADSVEDWTAMSSLTDIGFCDDNHSSAAAGAYEDGDAVVQEAAAAAVDGILESTDTVLTTGVCDLTSFAGTDYYSEDASAGYDGTEAIVSSADSTLSSTDTVVTTGTANLSNFAASDRYCEDGVANYDGTEAIVSSGDATLNSTDTVTTAGTCSLTNFGTDTLYYDNVVDSTYASTEDIVGDGDGSDLYNADQLTSLTVHNNGTALDADITVMNIWEDTNGNGTLDTGSDNQLVNDTGSPFFGAAQAATGTVYTSGSNEQRIFVSVDIAAVGVATDGRTIDAELRDTGGNGDADCSTDGEAACAVGLISTASDGPTDADVVNSSAGGVQTIDADPPSITSATTDDSEVIPDGYVDEIVVVFDEDIDGTTVVASDFTVTACDVGSATRTVTGATETAPGVVTLTVTEDATYDTGVGCTVTLVTGVDINTISDVPGNFAVSGVETVATTDGAAPQMIPVAASHETLDNNNDGTVDYVKVVFTEDMDDSSVVASEFMVYISSAAVGSLTESYSSGTPGGGNETDSVDDETLYLGVTSAAETILANKTDYSLLVSIWTPPSLMDLAGNTAVPLYLFPTADAAAPLAYLRETEDDDSNGQIDGILLTFTEDIDDSTLGAGAGGWDVTGYSGESVGTDGGVDDEKVLVSMTESGTPDTAATPTITYTAGTLADLATVPNAMQSTGALSTTDTAPVVIVDADTLDGYSAGTDGTTTPGAADGFLDALEMLLSEPLDDSTVASTGGDCGATAGGANLTSTLGEFAIPAGSITACNTGSAADDTLFYLILDNTTYSTDGLPPITLTPSTIADLIGNVMVAEVEVPDDTAPPVMLSTTTDDNDTDGQIDRLVIVLSEFSIITDGVAGDGFLDLALNNGYTIANGNYGTSATSFTLVMTESGASDTDAIVEATYTVNGGTIHKIADSAGNEMNTGTASGTENDGASPAPTDINYLDSEPNGSVDQVEIIFSEDVSTSTLEDIDFTIPETGDINMTDDTAQAVATNTVTLTVGADSDETSTPTTPPTVTYTRTAGTLDSIVDAAGNPVATFGPVVIDDNAAPYVSSTTVTYLDGGAFGATAGDGNLDSIDITFTENIALDECESGDWDLDSNGFTTFASDCATGSSVATNTISLAVSVNAEQTGMFSGGTEPDLSYDNTGGATPGSLRDTFNDPEDGFNETGSIFGFVMVDGAGPVILDTSFTSDTDGDGFIDEISVNVTEDIDDATLAIGDFTIVDGFFGAYTLVSAIDDDSGTIDVVITELGSASPSLFGDTGSTPLVTDLGTFADATGNSSTGLAEVVLDAALPTICVHADCNQTGHTFSDIDGDGNVDRATLIFSEGVENSVGGSLTSVPATTFDVGTFGGLDPLTDVVSAHTAGTATLTLSWTEVSTFPAGDGDTGDAWGVITSPAVVYDSAGNIHGGAAPVSFTDAAPPVIGAAYTTDGNNNGYLDEICVDLSEDLDGTTLDTADFTVVGYTVSSADQTPTCKSSLSEGVGVNLTEGAVFDTGATPNYTLGNGGFDDDDGNTLAASGPTTPTDRARPVVTSTNPGNGSLLIPRDGDLTVRFSEAMNTTTLDTFGTIGPGVDFQIDDSGVLFAGATGTAFALDGNGNTEMTITHDAFSNNGAIDVMINGTLTAQDLVANDLCGSPGNCGIDDYTFSFTARNSSGGGGGGGSPPVSTQATISLTAPGTGAAFTGGDSTTVNWTTGGSGITYIDVFWSADGGSTFGLLAQNLNPSASYAWAVPNTPTTNAIVRAVAYDGGKAELARDDSGVFTIALEDTLPQDAPPTGTLLEREEANVLLPPGIIVDDVITGPLSTVYYIGLDAKRHPFPHVDIFATWYTNADGSPDFSNVKTVTADDLAAISLGAPVLPRPGTKWVKIQSVPDTYLIEPGSFELRHIADEATAIALLGPSWNTNILDISPTFFSLFEFGPQVTEAEIASDWPVASIVKLVNDPAIYYVGENELRPFTSETAFFANHYSYFYMRTFDAISGANSLPIGSSISAFEDYLFSLQNLTQTSLD